MSQACSRQRALSVHNTATAINGWVSFNCAANMSGKRSIGSPLRSSRRSMSCSEQETKKYCCASRGGASIPGSSLGYTPWTARERACRRGRRTRQAGGKQQARPVMKVMLVKSTCSWKESVSVVLPHCRELPSTAFIEAVFGAQPSVLHREVGTPRFAFTASAMRRSTSAPPAAFSGRETRTAASVGGGRDDGAALVDLLQGPGRLLRRGRTRDGSGDERRPPRGVPLESRR